jgi:hypothetical protein
MRRRLSYFGVLSLGEIGTLKEKGAAVFRSAWYHCRMKKVLTVSEFARLGGKARAQKLSKRRRLEISRAANEAKRLKRAGFTSVPTRTISTAS